MPAMIVPHVPRKLALHPHRLAASIGQVVRGRVPLTQWQVDFVGPLPLSENAGFTFNSCRYSYRFSVCLVMQGC